MNARMVLDNIRNIKIDFKNPPLKNFQAYYSLRGGISMIARNIRACENDLKLQDTTPMSVMFHWFSISAVNLLRLIGLVEIMNRESWTSSDILNHSKEIRAHCKNYVESIIPEVLEYRNKVAAHFSITDPRPEDNVASLEFSIMPQVSWMKGQGILVGHSQWGTKGEKSEIPQWCLTEEFEKIALRCFPEVRLPPLLDTPKNGNYRAPAPDQPYKKASSAKKRHFTRGRREIPVEVLEDWSAVEIMSIWLAHGKRYSTSDLGWTCTEHGKELDEQESWGLLLAEQALMMIDALHQRKGYPKSLIKAQLMEKFNEVFERGDSHFEFSRYFEN